MIKNAINDAIENSVCNCYNVGFEFNGFNRDWMLFSDKDRIRKVYRLIDNVDNLAMN